MTITERQAAARTSAIRKLQRLRRREQVAIAARHDYAIVPPVDTIGHAVDCAVRENA